MKERGILMKPFLAQAAREKLKTQTRRLIHPDYLTGGREPHEIVHRAPYQVGDRLYIKEAFYAYGEWLLHADLTGKPIWSFIDLTAMEGYTHRFMDNPPEGVIKKRSQGNLGWHKRSPLFMPKSAARTWLEVTDVRAQKLQDISEEDAKAEGLSWEEATKLNVIEKILQDTEFAMWGGKPTQEPSASIYVQAFGHLWDAINGKTHPWKNNDWVWAYTFQLIEKGGAQ